jgi:protein transport protein HofC
MWRTLVSTGTGLDTANPQVPAPPTIPRRRGGFRLRHLLIAVFVCAVASWLAVLIGILVVGGFGLLVVFVVGLVYVLSRRRSTQQDALLWALAIAAERGMPLAPTLDAFASQCRGEYRRKVMAAAHYLRQGLSLVEAIEHEPGLFPRDAEVLIRVGSESGVLAAALREASTLQTAARGAWVALAMRFAYLLWVLVVLQLIVGFITYFITPKFEAIFADFGIPLPAMTMMTIQGAHVLNRYLIIFLPLFFLQLGLCLLVSAAALGVLPWNLPLVARAFHAMHSALILRCLARLVESDKPLDQGLATLARTYPVRSFRDRLAHAADAVKRGDDWCGALVASGLIRTAEAALLESARRVGNLPWALRTAAETGERRFVYRLQWASQWLLPLCVLTLGATVFTVAVSYFLPLISLIQRLAG